MPKTLVGKVKNKNFAYLWLMVGGSIGNILITLYSPDAWLIFLPSAILSILIAIAVWDKMQRPKIWLGIDLFLTCITLILLMALTLLVTFSQLALVTQLGVFLPDALIVMGAVFGIMNW